jgi:hypothetical protein
MKQYHSARFQLDFVQVAFAHHTSPASKRRKTTVKSAARAV